MSVEFDYADGTNRGEAGENIASDFAAIDIGKVWYRTSLLGSTLYAVDANGEVIAHAIYDPWGNPTAGTERDVNFAGIDNVSNYTGYTWDDVLGLYFAQNRFYDAENHRFTQDDPARDGANWYVYCGNNPGIWVDPWGLKPYSTKVGKDQYDLKVTDHFTDGVETVGGFMPLYPVVVAGALLVVGDVAIEPDPSLIPSTILDVANELLKSKWLGAIGTISSITSAFDYLFNTDYKIEEAIYNHIRLDYGKNKGYMAFLSCTRKDVAAKFTFAFAWMKLAVDSGDVKIMTGKKIKEAITYDYTYTDWMTDGETYTVTMRKNSILQSYHPKYDDDKLYFYTENEAYKGYLDELINILHNW